MTLEDHQRFRRRRAVAGLASLALLALLITAIGSHGGTHRPKKPDLIVRHAVIAHVTAAEQEALTHKAEEKAIDSVLAYTPAVVSGGSKGHELALTFDDGPGPYTQQLVATLNTLHVHAT